MLIELPESTNAATLRELNLTGIYINFEPFCLFKLHLSEKSKLHTILVYILKQTSHPFILGTSYLIQNKISLNFGNMDVSQKVANVRCTKRITIPPHSEMVVLGKLHQNIVH
jgi:hypothetical protein